jgi:hypothetical protein
MLLFKAALGPPFYLPRSARRLFFNRIYAKKRNLKPESGVTALPLRSKFIFLIKKQGNEQLRIDGDFYPGFER